jgi:syntaxin 1B/2/3
MQDRLGDLKKEGAFLEAPQDDKSGEAAERADAMQRFFAEIEQVKKTIAFVQEQTGQVHVLREQALKALRQQDSKVVSDKLDALVDTTQKQLGKTANMLAKLKESNTALSNAPGASAADTRVRTNLYENTVANFVTAVREYQKAQQAYKQDMRGKITRQIHVVAPEATAQDIDLVMKSGDPGAIYRTAILHPGANPVQQAFADAQSKFHDVLKLEESIVALNRMFHDMALLVEQQGEMLDQIEVNVGAAAEYTTKGKENIEGALKARKAARKKMLILVCILLLVAGVVMFIIPVPGNVQTILYVVGVVLILISVVCLYFLNPCKTLCSFN